MKQMEKGKNTNNPRLVNQRLNYGNRRGLNYLHRCSNLCAQKISHSYKFRVVICLAIVLLVFRRMTSSRSSIRFHCLRLHLGRYRVALTITCAVSFLQIQIRT